MIEYLHTGLAAYFHALKRPLSNKAVEDLFVSIRAQVAQPTQNLFRIVRQLHDGSRCSAICFSYERPVSFLDPAAGQVERIFGYLLIIERGNYAAVLKAGLEPTAAFKTRYFDKVDVPRIERALAGEEAVFEVLRLRSLYGTRYGLRGKTLEARDLRNNVAMTSASRFAPLGYRVRENGECYSATPNTGRIAMRSDRVGWQAAAAWAASTIDRLALDAGKVSPFIRNFARVLDLQSLPAATRPRYVAVDTITLAEQLYDEEPTIRLVRPHEEGWSELPRPEVEALFDNIDINLSINDELEVEEDSAGGADIVGRIKMLKSRISLRLNWPAIANIFVERLDHAVGQDPERIELVAHIDRENLFTVLFDQLDLAYLNGSLFQDSAFTGGGAEFMTRLVAEPALANANSEKGTFQANQTEFSETSVFRILVDQVAGGDEFLVCDDLGDEWADFIGLRVGARPATVSFYHAKHGAQSLSASSFHIGVGQAIKNLSRLALAADSMPGKFAGWAQRYNSENGPTMIERVSRGGPIAAIETAVEQVRALPGLNRQVFIVTSSLSRAQVAEAFQRVQEGHAPRAYFVQLYWLLTAFFAACAEIGAVGYVVCQE